MEGSFWDSNLFQTLVLIVTAGITLWIYFARRKANVRNAVTILMLQIRDIEKNIEYLLSEGIVDGKIQEKPLHYSAIIYEDNNWTKYSHLVVGRISQLAFENIDMFFKVAQQIREQQILIKNKLQQSMEYKGMHYYQGTYQCINSLVDRYRSGQDTQKLKLECKEEIDFVNSLYSSAGINVPPYVQLELTFGLEKTLRKYHKLTDGTAYAELEKLKK
ncbi:MAG: hypothetical protein IKB70_13175 [Bacilli bacterium]|nr:hypothetical protein [Bacilli bacterium]